MRSYTLECNYNTGRLVNHVPPAKGVNAREKEMGVAIERVTAGVTAMGASLTCAACSNTLCANPRTCSPCGHTFCAACLKAEMGGGGERHLVAVCPQCNGPAGRVLNVRALGAVAGTFAQQRQVLTELQVGAAAATTAGKLAAGARERVQARAAGEVAVS